MEEANIFLLSSLLDLALPLTTTADAAGYNNNGSPPSLILNLSLSRTVSNRVYRPNPRAFPKVKRLTFAQESLLAHI